MLTDIILRIASSRKKKGKPFFTVCLYTNLSVLPTATPGLPSLALQQLPDAAHYQYRFGVLRKLGMDRQETEHLILKQLAVWSGLPVTLAAVVSVIVVTHFFEAISAQISAYIGIDALLAQVGAAVCILCILLICYFISTWILFQKAVTESR